MPLLRIAVGILQALTARRVDISTSWSSPQSLLRARPRAWCRSNDTLSRPRLNPVSVTQLKLTTSPHVLEWCRTSESVSPAGLPCRIPQALRPGLSTKVALLTAAEPSEPELGSREQPEKHRHWNCHGAQAQQREACQAPNRHGGYMGRWRVIICARIGFYYQTTESASYGPCMKRQNSKIVVNDKNRNTHLTCE